MTQIDSTAQTDLGVNDHEELLIPYKAIYTQLLGTIKDVVSQTLDSQHGNTTPIITNEILELALKDNLSSLMGFSPPHDTPRSPSPRTGTSPIASTSPRTSTSPRATTSPRITASPIVTTTASPIATSIASSRAVQSPTNATCPREEGRTPVPTVIIPSPRVPTTRSPRVPVSPKTLATTPKPPQKTEEEEDVMVDDEVPMDFEEIKVETTSLAPSPSSRKRALIEQSVVIPPPSSTESLSKTTSQLLTLIELNALNAELQKQKPAEAYPVGSASYNFLTGDPSGLINKSSFSKPQLGLNHLITSTHPLLNTVTNPLFSAVFSKHLDQQQQQTPAPVPPQPKIFTPELVRTSEQVNTSPIKQGAFTQAHDLKPVASVADLRTKSLLQNTLAGVVTTQPPLSNLVNLSLPNVVSNASPTTLTTTPKFTGFQAPKKASLSDMEVHQNFLKQMNILNQATPSMLGPKGINPTGQENVAGDIEKVLMDIQMNLGSMKPDPVWSSNKDKLYKCPHCETSFARRQYLSNHIINVHNLKTCPECKTTFSNEEAFKAHLVMHPKKEYECGSCNKSFNSVYLLKNHRKTHVKDKPFACNICGKTFADKYYLRNHFSIHSPVKPYSCPVCGRGFASSSALRYHSFQHTGEKPAKCQYCPSEFVQKNQLKLHIARKHKELISMTTGIHDADIIPGNISKHTSPSQSPARTSPARATKSVSPSPLTVVTSPKKELISMVQTSSIMARKNKIRLRLTSANSSEEVPTSSSERHQGPTVSAATSQLQQLIASLTPDKEGSQKSPRSSSNITLSSPFSRITDGINQLLENGQITVNEKTV